jgi:hypothetical protein
VAAAGCDSADESRRVPTSVLTGTWLGECVAIDEFGAQSRQATMMFGPEQRFVRTEQAYADTACREPIYHLRYQGRHELAVTWQDYVYQIDLWVEQMVLTPEASTWITEAAKNQYCGLNDWSTPLQWQPAQGHLPACPLQFLTTDYMKSLVRLVEPDLQWASGFAPGVTDDADFTHADPALQFVRQSSDWQN